MKAANRSFQSFLGESIERFLAHKRALGSKFEVEENALRRFDPLASVCRDIRLLWRKAAASRYTRIARLRQQSVYR